jgi:hypothetical protein
MKFESTIAFINPRSGGKHGTKVYVKLRILLGKHNVFDLSKGGPEAGYEKLRFNSCYFFAFIGII